MVNLSSAPLQKSSDETKITPVWTQRVLYGACFACLMGAMGLVGPAHAQTFEKNVISGPCSPCDTRGVSVIDLDDDGDQDAVPNGSIPGWFENTSTGLTGLKRTLFAGFQGSTLTDGLTTITDAVDITGDGKAELMSSGSWYVNQGGGNFSDRKGPLSITDWNVADMDGDGLPDVVSGNSYYQNSTSSGLEGAVATTITSDPLATQSLLDLNADDRIDILGIQSDTLGWIENQGVEGGGVDFGAFQSFATAGDETVDGTTVTFRYEHVYTTNLDADSDEDVLAVFRESINEANPEDKIYSKVVWYENRGSGSFSNAKVIADASRSLNGVARSVDVDGDSDKDVVTFSGGGRDSDITLQWHENDGSGTFQAPKNVDDIEGVRIEQWMGVVLGDLSSNGRKDLIFVHRKPGRTRYAKWYPNLENGTFGDQRSLGTEPDLGASSIKKVADVNQDDLTDLEVSGFDINLLLENAGSEFPPLDTLVDRSDILMGRTRNPEFFEPIDDDSYPDFVYVNDLQLGWAQNDGSGQSRSYTIFEDESVYDYDEMVPGDVDGDGDSDLVAQVDQSRSQEYLKVYENDGSKLTGGSSNRVEISVKQGIKELISADLEGDGGADLVANFSTSRGSGDAALVWYEDTGDNWNFSAGTDDLSEPIVIDKSSAENGLPRAIEAVDVDSDGDLDIINTSLNGRRTDGSGMRWYENVDGKKTFSGPHSIDLFIPNRDYSYGRSLEVADVDGDGDPDVLVYEAPSGSSYASIFTEGGDLLGRRNVYWHENQGGTFAPEQVLIKDLERPVLKDARVPWAFDVNGDNVVDVTYSSGQVVGGPSEFQKLAWFENKDPVVARRTMAPGDTTSFSEAHTEIRLSSATDGSGAVTVRRPISGPTSTGSIDETSVLEDRLVIEADTGLTVGADSKVRVDASSIAGIEDPTRVTFYRRDTTDRGSFQSLPTSYDSDAAELVVTTDSFREFVPATTTDKTPPAAPDSLRASGTTAGIDLTWTTSDSTDVAEYRVYRDTVSIDSAAGPSALTPVATTTAGDTTYLDEDVRGSLTYYYRVTAVDDALSPNESGFSEAAEARPVVPKITDVRPSSGAPGTLVRVYGQKFDPTASNNTVRFGTATATVEQASSTLLRVRVPTGARGLAPVTVTRGAATARAARRFGVANGGGTSLGAIGAGVDALESGSVSWGDFDDDRDLDVLVTGRDSDFTPRTILYENKGSGGFEAVGAGLTGVEGQSASAWGDFDADGDLDLVLAGSDADNNKTTTIYENKGGGTFEPIGANLTGVTGASVDWGDYNGDGRLDLVVAGGDANFNVVITIYENKGGGTFEPIGAGLTGARFGSVSWGDYNDDGLLDIALTGRDPNNDPLTVIYKNQGSGTFGSISAPVTDTEEGEAVWADYDADDDLDLAVTGKNSSGNATATIYQNKGGDTFDPLSAGINGVKAAAADWGDVNGDGAPDLVVAGDSSSDFSEKSSTTIYENQGGGSFAAADAGLGGAADGAVAWGDYEGDGDLDLIVNDGSNLATTIYENQAAPPTASVTKTVSGDGTVPFDGTGAEIQFSNTSGSGDVTVDRYAETPDNTDGISEANVSNARLTIGAGGDLSFDAELRLAVSRFDGIDDPTNVTVYKRDTEGTGTFASLSTTVGTNGTSGDVSDDTLYATSSSFSEFVLASNSEPLPVEMAGFDAHLEGEAVQISWETASERGNAGFDVQRKDGGANGKTAEWTTVGFVEGVGTTADAQSYHFTDGDLPYEADRLIYRLKQVDTDGTAHYSKTVTVERGIEALQFLGTFPNPASRRATVQYALPERQDVRLRLYDALGRRVRTIVSDRKKGRHEKTIDVGDLSSGVYFLRLRAGGQTRTQKVTVVQ